MKSVVTPGLSAVQCFALRALGRRHKALAAVAAFGIAATAPSATLAANAIQNEVVQVPAIAMGTDTIPVVLSRVGTRLSTGQPIGTAKTGFLCLPKQALNYSAGNYKSVKERLPVLFYDEAAAAGFKTPEDRDNLFSDDAPSTDYVVGVVMESEHLDVCFPRISFGDTTAKGVATYDLDWQIYSPIEKRIVATYHTTGTYQTDRGTPQSLADGALAINVRKFLASQEFRSVFIGKPRPPSQLLQPTGFKPIALSNRGDGPASVADDVGDVVALVTGDGFGSGFLIDETGLLLTNRHVVGDSKFLKVRWPDGFETVGEVIRSDPRRDVALVKTDARGRKPLRLASASPSPGDDVFAIGTPLDQKFSNTVTKGVVSAARVFDGLNYIQSDVVVNHGNSGGPLLDHSGRVIGITVQGYQADGAPLGINLFIPVRDALEFLSVTPNTHAGATASLQK